VKRVILAAVMVLMLSGIVFAEEPVYMRVGQGDMLFKGYVQTRYSYLAGMGNTDVFSVKSVYLGLSGKMVPQLTYDITFDLAATDGKPLRYIYLKYIPCAFCKVTMGQFAIPFSLEYFTSASMIESAERAKAVTTLSHQIDIGLMFEGDVLNNNLLSYSAALINGSGYNTTDNNEYKDAILRLSSCPVKNLTVAAAGMYGIQPRSGNNEGDRIRYNATAKYEGYNLKVQGEYLHQLTEQKNCTYKTANGFYVLAGYTLFSIIQPIVKYEEYDSDLKTGSNREYVTTAGFNAFILQNLKITADYRVKREEVEVDNDEFILQAQVKF
jgi:hypothetical protein